MSRRSLLLTEPVGEHHTRVQIVTSYGVKGPPVVVPTEMVPGALQAIHEAQRLWGFELYGEQTGGDHG